MSAVPSRALLVAALLVPAAGCDLYFRGGSDDTGDDDGPGPLPDAAVSIDADDTDASVPIDAPPVQPPNPGFVAPTTTTRANVFRNGQWQEVGAADWSCLAQPPAENVPDTGYTLTGAVRDYQNNQATGNVAITASAGAVTLAQATSSNTAGSRGTYRLDIPALPPSVTRVRFTLTGMGARKTVDIERYLGSFGFTTLDLPLVSEQTAAALPALVGEVGDPADGLVLGEVRDCQGRQVSGAVVALSTSATLVVHWPAGVTYYFSAGGTSTPVRHSVRTETNRDGRFTILGPTPLGGAEGTVQAWGYLSEADRAVGALKLLGKAPAVIEASTVSHILTGRQRASGVGN